MRYALKHVFGLILCLMLIVTAQSMAVSRGAAAATGQMVICVGSQTTTIYMDAQGNRTAAPHVCPDCVLSFAEGPTHHPGVCFQFISQKLPRAIVTAERAQRTQGKGYFSRAPPLRSR